MNPISDPNFKDEINKLDNPVWFSLTETQSPFAVGNHSIKFYRPEYCPFGGFEKLDDIREGIDKYSRTCENFFVVGEKPEVNPNIKLVKELVCDQMIREDLV
ncbi:MAG TPA: hypothetical protein VFV08_12125, partial [Puia sp.]|nr:hypothetical protein [Puia sp.]